MKTIHIRIKQFDNEHAFLLLLQESFQLLYTVEDIDTDTITLVGEGKLSPEFLMQPFILSCIEEDIEIDWQNEWTKHATGFQDESLTIALPKELNPRYDQIKLTYGAGFGDLSHPTTRLMLALIAPYAKGSTIIDIGTGSGVLALYAYALGAQHVIGLDIEQSAIVHAENNRILNEYSENILQFMHTDQFVGWQVTSTSCAYMNMITSEQEAVFKSYTFWNNIQHLFTSGVLEEESKQYVDLWKKRGFTPALILQEDIWCGYHFIRGAV